MDDNYFHKNFHILSREALLIEWTLYTGLTHLRNSSFDQVGKSYVGFFNLSIGIERLCKFTIISDHMVKNNFEAPKQSEIKKFSHDILNLTKKVILISKDYEESSIADMDQNSTYYRVLSFLNKFAKVTRYENIDSLCDESPEESHMDEWLSILNFVIENEVPSQVKDREKIKSDITYDIFKENTFFMLFGHDDKLIPGENLFITHSLQQKAISRIVRHLVFELQKIRSLLRAIGFSARKLNFELNDGGICMFPDMGDFFQGLLTYEGMNVLRKKRWQYP